MNNVDIVYTPWTNLKKTLSMDVGQVGFFHSKLVSYYLTVISMLWLNWRDKCINSQSNLIN